MKVMPSWTFKPKLPRYYNKTKLMILQQGNGQVDLWVNWTILVDDFIIENCITQWFMHRVGTLALFQPSEGTVLGNPNQQILTVSHLVLWEN